MKHKQTLDTLPEMTDEYVARWYALIQALHIIWNHADKYNIDLDDVNLDTRKIVREYVNPISGDILHELNNLPDDQLKVKYKLTSDPELIEREW